MQKTLIAFLQELKTSYGEIMLEGQLPPDASEGRPYAVEHHIDLLPGTKTKVQPLRSVAESYVPVGGDLSSLSREMRSLGEIWSSWSFSYTEKIYSHVTTSNSIYL